MAENEGAAGRTVFLGATVAILALCVFQAIWAFRTKQTLEEAQKSLARIDHVEELLDRLASDQDFLVDDISRIARKIDDLVASMENRGAPAAADEAEAPQIDWTQPQLFAAAQKSAGEYGIELTADEVRVPSRFVLRQGAIEYFGVLKGGKEHETLVSLIGNTAKGERRPKDFGARLNNAIQAIGFKRGKPVRFTASGRVPPEGESAYLFLEWEEKGEKVLVRAEDLVWNRTEEKPMERRRWIYVGSAFVKAGDGPGPVFAADLTAEAIATYSSPDTIFDNTAKGDTDDDTYLVATPRMPDGVDDCTLIIRRLDREPTRTFPDDPASGEAEKRLGDQGGQRR